MEQNRIRKQNKAIKETNKIRQIKDKKVKNGTCKTRIKQTAKWHGRKKFMWINNQNKCKLLRSSVKRDYKNVLKQKNSAEWL